jgi:hypothetical protein
MPKPAYDRIKQADNRSEVFIRTPYWTPDVESRFEAWAADCPIKSVDDAIDSYLQSDVAVSFKTLNGSVCCTLAHQTSKDHDLPYLLTGWSDNCLDALMVAMFKLAVMLDGIWQAPPEAKPTRRR